MEAVAPDRRLAGRYILEELVSAGPVLHVWRATDEVLERGVFVKVLRRDLAADPGFLRDFHADAVAAARLQHPSIVSVFDTGVDGDTCYIVTEHFAGEDLGARLALSGPLEAPTAVRLLLPVLSALEAAHRKGVVHCDLKPGCILVSPDGRVKVCDFALARAALSRGGIAGTAALHRSSYGSLPWEEGYGPDELWDVYGAGAVLYQMLTGRSPAPSQGSSGAAPHRNTACLPPRAVRGGIPRTLERIVVKAMAPDPKDRFPSVQAMRAALEPHAGPAGEGSQGPGPRAAPTDDEERYPASSMLRSWMFVPLAVAVVAGILIAGGLAAGRLRLGGPLGVQLPEGQSSQPMEQAVDIPVLASRDYDPLGDGTEQPERAALAIDRDTSTYWDTDHYSTASFGRLKAAVGLWLDLGRPVRLSRITITAPLTGWTYQLRAGPTPQTAYRTLLSRAGTATFTLAGSGRTTVELRSVRTSGILIWITGLAPDRRGFAAAVGEVAVAGTPE